MERKFKGIRKLLQTIRSRGLNGYEVYSIYDLETDIIEVVYFNPERYNQNHESDVANLYSRQTDTNIIHKWRNVTTDTNAIRHQLNSLIEKYSLNN
ncbi:hypothetical protein [Veillonella intestinalis]|uniref:hypothetical protein n=1 Tax=Veillonella intestinalis TaxID=2941341 RepID=UPI0020422CE1|nr:hypothetical protein [Veillonella intestinalis]